MSNENDTIQVDIKGLDQLIKSLKGNLPMGRIGVLGGGGRENSKSVTNAEIGARHEFGEGVPKRSWLRMPIIVHLEKFLEKSGLFDEDLMKVVLKAGSVVPLIKKIMIVAEGVVAEGFASNGFGTWQPWKTPGYQSNTGLILVDTQQLRNSVTSDVKE